MLYIHIPFCKGKCIYCDFYSGGNPDWKKYLKAVASELSDRIDELRGDSLTSVYIGGGTPSLIPASDFLWFINVIKEKLFSSGVVSPEGWEKIEFTIEVNPEDVTMERIISWKDGGINRVSMGVQSLIDEELQLLKRRHCAERVTDALLLLKKHFNNISLDVIYGIPGQTRKTLSETLSKIIAFKPQHISAYALTYESNTPLYIFRKTGKIRECSEDEYLNFEELTSRTLQDAGYERYEISNYALKGYRSRHNSGYWSGFPYIGLGPSASSYNGYDTRRTNLPDIKSYLKGKIEFTKEFLTKEERLHETIMVRLRTREGLDLNCLSDSEKSIVIGKAQRFINTGDLSLEDLRLSLTNKGILISDYIILNILP